MFYHRRGLPPTPNFSGSAPPYPHHVSDTDYPPPHFVAPRYGPSHLPPYSEETIDGHPRCLLTDRGDSPQHVDADPRRPTGGMRPFVHLDRQDAPFEVDYLRPRSSHQMSSGGPPRFHAPMDLPSLPRPRAFHSSSTRPFQPLLEKPRRVGLSQSQGDKIRRSTSSVYCDLCKVACGGLKAFNEHQNGQRHKKRVSQAEAMERIKQSNDASQIAKVSITSNAKELRCELCNISCTGTEAFSAHLVGRVHQRAVRLHRELGKPIPLVTQTPEITAVPEVIKITDDSDAEPPKIETPATRTEATCTPTTVPVDTAVTLEQPDTTTSAKLVGAEYVTEIPAPGGRGVHFRCNLCECQFTNKEAKEVHMRGRRHCLQYKKKVDPLLVIEPKPRNISAKRKAQSGRRLEMSQLAIPPMSSSNYFPSAGLLPFSDNIPFYGFQAAFGRFPYRLPEPGSFRGPRLSQHPNVVVENRYLHIKHSSIVPTELEAKAMKTVVSVCEHSLKSISNDLVKEVQSTHHTSTAVENRTKTPNESHSKDEGNWLQDSPEYEGGRLLRSVVRVGSLGKSLLLRGDHEGNLVLDCSEWPTTEVVKFFQNELAKTLPLKDSNYSYTLCSSLDTGKITVVAARKREDTTESAEGSAEGSAVDTWPVITVHIWLTSSIVRRQHPAVNGASGAVEADGSSTTASPALHTAPEQPSCTNSSVTQSRSPEQLLMFAQGERIAKRHCLDALDAVDQAKWFQSQLVKYPLGIIARILLDFMRANKPWLSLDQFSVFALLERLLSAEIQSALRMSGNPAFAHPSRPGMPVPPFSPPIRGGAPSCQPSPPITPARLFRLFFESISSGILLILRPEALIVKDGPDSGSAELANDLFFTFKRLAESPIDVREEITAFAQICLRQIAFKQLYKVLRMEPLVHSHSRQHVSPPNPSGPESEVNDDSIDDNGNSIGGVKRRRTDQESDGNTDDAHHANDEEQAPSETALTDDPEKSASELVEPSVPPVTSAAMETDTTPAITTRSSARRGRQSR